LDTGRSRNRRRTSQETELAGETVWRNETYQHLVHAADGSLLGGNMHTIRKAQTLQCMPQSSRLSRVYIVIINWATYNNKKHHKHEHQNQFSI